MTSESEEAARQLREAQLAAAEAVSDVTQWRGENKLNSSFDPMDGF